LDKPITGKNMTLAYHVNVPYKLAQQAGFDIPQMTRAEAATDMPMEVEEAETPKPKPPPQLSQEYKDQRKQLRTNIEKNENILKFLEPGTDSTLITHCEQQIKQDKSSISSLKPLPMRIDTLQKVVDGQHQRILRATQAINNWQLLKDAWQEKHDEMNADLMLLKKQLEEQPEEVPPPDSGLDNATNTQLQLQLQLQAQHASQLQSQLTNSLQTIAKIVTAAVAGQGETDLFAAITQAAQQFQIGGAPAPRPSLGTVPPDVATTDPFSTMSPGNTTPGAPQIGIDDSPPPLLKSPQETASSATLVPTPARARTNVSATSEGNRDGTPPAHRRRDRSHSARRTGLPCREPRAPPPDGMTSDEIQSQEDLLASLEASSPAPISPLRGADAAMDTWGREEALSSE